MDRTLSHARCAAAASSAANAAAGATSATNTANTANAANAASCACTVVARGALPAAARGARCMAALAVLGALVACATPLPQPGQPRDAVLQAFGAPTARYAMPEGAERLEYASGPFGRVTWMVDLDREGRVRATTQVLNEAHFADFMVRAPGMSREQLLREIGTPGERKHGGYQGGQVWSWRYPTNDCLWFQVSIGDDAVVRSAGYAIDPRCDVVVK